MLTFVFVLSFNSGDSRFYILAGEGIGWIVYHITLGEFIYKFSGKIVKKIRESIRLIFGKTKTIFLKKKNNHK